MLSQTTRQWTSNKPIICHQSSVEWPQQQQCTIEMFCDFDESMGTLVGKSLQARLRMKRHALALALRRRDTCVEDTSYQSVSVHNIHVVQGCAVERLCSLRFSPPPSPRHTYLIEPASHRGLARYWHYIKHSISVNGAVFELSIVPSHSCPALNTCPSKNYNKNIT